MDVIQAQPVTEPSTQRNQSTDPPALPELSYSLIDRHRPADPTVPLTPFGLYLVPSHQPEAELARSIERDVFFEYFGNTPELLAEEYGRYEQASLFLTVMDHVRVRPAGMIRVIQPSPAGLKTLHDLERVWEQPLDP